MYPLITIDGASGSGKGALGVALCATYRLTHLDSGALYRTLALYFQKLGEPKVDNWQRFIEAAPIKVADEGEQVVIYLDGARVEPAIRTPEISTLASKISSISAVRDALLSLQRLFDGKGRGLVADGRDMGTIVFPKAPLKFFLVCPLEIRAKRRELQLQALGKSVKMDELLREMEARRQAGYCSRNSASLCRKGCSGSPQQLLF